MTTGQTLNALETILDRLLDEISHASITLQAKGSTPKPTDTSYHDFWDKIAGYQTALARIVRDLKSIEHRLDFRSRVARRLPREFRYSANQSVKSHRGHSQQVYEKAARVEAALRDFIVQSQTPTTGDVMSGITKLTKELEKTLSQQDYKTVTEQLNAGRPQLDNVARDVPVLQGTPLTLLVTLIVVWIGARAKRR